LQLHFSTRLARADATPAQQTQSTNGQHTFFVNLLSMGNIGFLLFLLVPLFQPAANEQSHPLESRAVETLHRTVQIDGENYSAILTRPQAPGKYPAVFVIGGLGCYSLEDLKPGEPYYELLTASANTALCPCAWTKMAKERVAARPVTARSLICSLRCAAP
jgi:hypothetical protein